MRSIQVFHSYIVEGATAPYWLSANEPRAFTYKGKQSLERQKRSPEMEPHIFLPIERGWWFKFLFNQGLFRSDTSVESFMHWMMLAALIWFAPLTTHEHNDSYVNCTKTSVENQGPFAFTFEKAAIANLCCDSTANCESDQWTWWLLAVLERNGSSVTSPINVPNFWKGIIRTEGTA